MPLLPRFYSIANSAHVFPDEIHLTVAYVTYMANGQVRKGIGSYFLCSYAQTSTTPIPIYLQSSNHFTLPQDPNASIILIGPWHGDRSLPRLLTRADGLERPLGATGFSSGRGTRASDFYYESFFTQLESQGRLRLDLAFSRDSVEKTYVQNKMYEERKSLWDWLQEGAYFYVCGDAEKMAKDVDAMLRSNSFAKNRGMTEEDAHLYLKRLRAEKAVSYRRLLNLLNSASNIFCNCFISGHLS